MAAISVERVKGNVRITIEVEGKRASITVTPERARRLSAQLITQSLEGEASSDPLAGFNDILNKMRNGR